MAISLNQNQQPEDEGCVYIITISALLFPRTALTWLDSPS